MKSSIYRTGNRQKKFIKSFEDLFTQKFDAKAEEIDIDPAPPLDCTLCEAFVGPLNAGSNYTFLRHCSDINKKPWVQKLEQQIMFNKQKSKIQKNRGIYYRYLYIVHFDQFIIQKDAF